MRFFITGFAGSAFFALVACNQAQTPTPQNTGAELPGATAEAKAATGAAPRHFGAAFTVAAGEPLAQAIGRIASASPDASARAAVKDATGATEAKGEHACGENHGKGEANKGDGSSVESCGAAVADNSGSIVRVRGTVGSVCMKAGCWMVLQDGKSEARIFTREHRFFLPKDIVGKTAEVEGTLRAKTLSHEFAKHLAEDAGSDPSKVVAPQQEYLVTATGVSILDS